MEAEPDGAIQPVAPVNIRAEAVAVDYTDVYIWVVNNKWWLFAVAPFVIAFIFVKIWQGK